MCYSGLGFPVITDSLANDASLGNFFFYKFSGRSFYQYNEDFSIYVFMSDNLLSNYKFTNKQRDAVK